MPSQLLRAQTRSTCPYCGVGCGVIIESQGSEIVGVRGDPAHPANLGRLCSKGASLHLTASASIARQTRLLQPMRRLQRRDKEAVPVGWDNALDFASGEFARIIAAHGPDAVGFYVSGQLLTEDYYVFNKLAKGLIGTNNIDTNSRLCMSSAVAGYKQSLGADAPPCSYSDMDQASCIFIAGSNTAFAHPVLFQRIEAARAANPALKIVVCDPRRTETAGIADLFLPIQPGSDVALFNGMLHTMLWEGWTDAAFIASFTNGFAELKRLVQGCTPEVTAQICGVAKADIFEATRLFATSPATLSLYCQGLNQSAHGTAKNTALINLHLACGQIGKPGAGPFSLTGQPNAMGGREVGGLANLLSGHRDMANPAHRAEVAALWGVESVPDQPGKTAVEMFQAAADGEIKALYIACTNPAQSLPDQRMVRRALERCEIVVLQEAFATTATCAFADVLLPASTWGEKNGTVTNSERRISRVRPAVPAPGAARADWQIAVDFAQRLQGRLLVKTSKPLFNYPSAEAVWCEHRESTKGRDLDITGMDYPLLEAAPQQWPMPSGHTTGRERLYEDKIFPTADGRARFVAKAWQLVAEPCDARYPFALTTGRLRDQWHGMGRTGTLGRLFGHASEPVVQLNPADMKRLQLDNGDWLSVASRRGKMLLRAEASASLNPSQAFAAMHWGSEFISGQDAGGLALAGINAVTNPAHCPDSKQPELKHTAVRITPAPMPWSLIGMAWLPDENWLQVQQQLRQLMGEFATALCVPFANKVPMKDAGVGGLQKSGLLFRAVHTTAPPPAILAHIESLLGLGLQATGVLRYADSRRGQQRAVRLQAVADTPASAHRLEAFLLAGDAAATHAEAWLKPMLLDCLPIDGRLGLKILQPGLHPPTAMLAGTADELAGNTAIVCACLGVSAKAIRACLDTAGPATNETERLQMLQKQLACGTGCGACLPEVRRMVRASTNNGDSDKNRQSASPTAPMLITETL